MNFISKFCLAQTNSQTKDNKLKLLFTQGPYDLEIYLEHTHMPSKRHPHTKEHTHVNARNLNKVMKRNTTQQH